TIRNLTIREIMEHMEAVTEIRFSGRYGKVVAEADRLQRKKSWIALAFRWKHSYTSRENRFKDAMMY
ncbi:MAG: hypothetical protein LBJ14_06005, partial [Desulfarculales bacterium]|nr:hypothetical protein [Desulfarculales bacterium]